MSRVAKQNIREKILEAAERRLWHYGIKKTTIDEIAADAGVGKGTVYLYFDSKEDISLAIFVSYKLGILREQEEIARDSNLDTFEKIREFLLLPVLSAHLKCSESPEAQDLIAVLKPHLADHLRPYIEKERQVLADILTDGIKLGDLSVDDPCSAARSLKLMTMGFMPPFPCVSSREAIEREIDLIVKLAIRGLAGRSPSQETDVVESGSGV